MYYSVVLATRDGIHVRSQELEKQQQRRQKSAFARRSIQMMKNMLQVAPILLSFLLPVSATRSTVRGPRGNYIENENDAVRDGGRRTTRKSKSKKSKSKFKTSDDVGFQPPDGRCVICSSGFKNNKPTALTLEYNPEGSNSLFQPPKKATCIGGTYPLTATVQFENKEGKTQSFVVQQGTVLVLEGLFDSNTEFEFSDGTDILRSCTIHTSCSVPLVQGDQIGPFLILGGEGPVITCDVPSNEPSENPSTPPSSTPSATPTINAPVAQITTQSPFVSRETLNEITPCIAVIDESRTSQSLAIFERLWSQFRTTYPKRPFCLLQPEPELPSALFIPPAFFNDNNTIYSQVNRDFGVVASRSDWFDICGLDGLRDRGVVDVAVFIDNSGSLTTPKVQASYDLLLSSMEEEGLALVAGIENQLEDWISPFLIDFT